MKKLKTFFIIFFCFCFMGCQADSSLKKYSYFKGQIVDSVRSSYNPSVDILFIIDNSSSTEKIQELMAKNSELFINKFLDTGIIDYRIAVTSSTTNATLGRDSENRNAPSVALTSKTFMGSLSRCNDLAKEQNYEYHSYVERTTPKAHECLKEMMELGVEGNDIEHFFDIPNMTLLGKQSSKSDFYRPKAHLAIFIITDSFDQSGIESEDFYGFLLNLKQGDESRIHYAAVIITLDVIQYGCKKEESPPTKLQEVVDLFGSQGYQFNLCQFNYGKSLAEFASHLVDSALTVPLDRLPDVGTIEVYYEYGENSRLIPNGSRGWIYNVEDNTIHLSRDIQLEEFGGKFSVRYNPIYIFEKQVDEKTEVL